MLWLETVIISAAWLKCYLLPFTLLQTWRKEMGQIVSFLFLICHRGLDGFYFFNFHFASFDLREQAQMKKKQKKTITTTFKFKSKTYTTSSHKQQD